MFKSLFKKKKKVLQTNNEDKLTAVACLLVEAALIDGNFGDNEKEIIVSIIKKQFQVNDNKEIMKLIDKAESDLQNSGDLVSYTRIVKENWEINDRIDIIEMLWKVCLIDGIIEPYEDMLIRRISGLIYVSDKDRNIAKKKAMGVN